MHLIDLNDKTGYNHSPYLRKLAIKLCEELLKGYHHRVLFLYNLSTLLKWIVLEWFVLGRDGPESYWPGFKPDSNKNLGLS